MGQSLPTTLQLPGQVCCKDDELTFGWPSAACCKTKQANDNDGTAFVGVGAKAEHYPVYGQGEPTRKQLKGSVFQVTLDREPGEAVGIDLDYEPNREAMPIRSVCGPIAQAWNEANPDKALLPGDRVVAVNGVRDWAGAMVEAIHSETPRLVITVVRLQEGEDAEDWHFVYYWDVMLSRRQRIEAKRGAGQVKRSDRRTPTSHSVGSISSMNSQYSHRRSSSGQRTPIGRPRTPEAGQAQGRAAVPPLELGRARSKESRSHSRTSARRPTGESSSNPTRRGESRRNNYDRSSSMDSASEVGSHYSMISERSLGVGQSLRPQPDVPRFATPLTPRGSGPAEDFRGGRADKMTEERRTSKRRTQLSEDTDTILPPNQPPILTIPAARPGVQERKVSRISEVSESQTELSECEQTKVPPVTVQTSGDDSAKEAEALAEAREGLLPPWQPKWSRTQQRCFFFDPVSGETCWEKPTTDDNVD